MAQKQYPLINNFSKGELSSRMEGRVEIQGYYQGCKIMENCIMVAQGGAEKRPGTIYVGSVYEPAILGTHSYTRLIPFEVNDDEIYMVELGHTYLRIWNVLTKTLVQDGGGDLVIGTPYNEADISTIQYAQTEGVLFLVHQNYPIRRLDKNSSGFTFNTMGAKVAIYNSTLTYKRGDVVYYLGVYYIAQKTLAAGTTPISGQWDRTGLGFTDMTVDITAWASGSYAVGDYTVHEEVLWRCIRTAGAQEPGYPVPTLTYGWTEVDHWFWFGEDYIAILNGKYGVGEWKTIGGLKLIIGRWIEIEYRTPTWPSISYWEDTGIALPNIISPQTLYKWLVGSTYDNNDYAFDPTSFEVFRCLEDSTTGGSLASNRDWDILDGNPMFNAEGDYPAAISFMNDRLFLAGTKNRPQTIMASMIGDHNNFTMGSDDDDAFVFTIAADRSSRIKWLMAKDVLMIGTTSSEWLVTGNLTPTSVQALRQSAYGSDYQQAIFVADSLLFFQKGGRKLREYVYSNDNKTYLANDMTFFADHITKGGIRETTYQLNPDSILWIVKPDGVTIGLTYDRLNQIAGWHKHTTQGLFESLSSIDSQDDEDELWFIVNRNINGNEERYVEYLHKRDFNNQSEAVFVDAAYTQQIGDTFAITSILWSATKITVTFVGTADFIDTNHIKISASDTDFIDGYVFEVADLASQTFNLVEIGTTNRTLDYDTGSGAIPVIGEIVTGGTSGAIGEIIWVASTATAVAGSIKLKAVAGGPFQTGEVLTGDVGLVAQADGADIPPYYNIDTFTDPETGTMMKVTPTILTGIDHLEGKTVSILGDGAVFPSQAVTAGVITLESECNIITVGLPYTMRLQPESIELPGSPTMGAKRRISKATLRLYNSLGGKVGPDEANLEELKYRSTDIPFGSPPSLFTGIMDIPVDSSSEQEASILILNDQPLPMTVLALITDITYSR